MISGADTQQAVERQFFVVSDCLLAQHAVHELLTRKQTFSCAGLARSFVEANELLPAPFSGVLIVTASNMNLDSIDQLEASIKQKGLKVLVLAPYSEHHYPRYYKHIGVLGQLTLQGNHSQLLQAVETVIAGEEFVDPSLSPLMANGTPRERSLLAYHSLSSREHQVMAKVVQGQSIKEMSKALFLSPKTVSTYRYRLFEKLGVRNDAELVRLAFLHGLTRDEKPQAESLH